MKHDIFKIAGKDALSDTEYKEAWEKDDEQMMLTAFRNYYIRKLRDIDYHHMPMFKPSENRTGLADYLIGDLSEEDYRRCKKATYFDFYHLSGKLGTLSETNWLARPPHPESEWYAGRSDKMSIHWGGFFVQLLYEFWHSEKRIYLDKWIEITSDFCRNQKKMMDSLDEDMKRTNINESQFQYWINWNPQNAASSLFQAGRLTVLIKCLALIAKSLPMEKQTSLAYKRWDMALRPVVGRIYPEALAWIPAPEFADIVLALVRDYPDALAERYLKNLGHVAPNQQLMGLYSLLLLTSTFSELTGMSDLASRVNAMLDAYADQMFYDNGGMVEQSFNYNFGDLAKIKEIIAILTDMVGTKSLCKKLKEKVKKFNNLVLSLCKPTGGLFLNGTYNGELPSEIQKASFKFKPVFTSIAFPDSGYFVLRDGWAKENSYMSLTAARPTVGHGAASYNALELTAYGKDLLISGGPPWYEKQMAPQTQRSAYDKFTQYFGESSSYKYNTVLVNGQSQNRKTADKNTEGNKSVGKITQTQFYTSDVLDLLDAEWSGGYNGHEKELNEIRHRRQVLFIRPAQMYIVTDQILGLEYSKDLNKFEFTQVWGFPPWEYKVGIHGFHSEDINAEESVRSISTSSTTGGNVCLYQFCPVPVHYEKYYGSTNPHLGWYSRSISSEKIPKVDVHVHWKDSRALPVTLIKPMRGNDSQISFIKNLSQDTIKSEGGGMQSGFCLTTLTGFEIRYNISAEYKKYTLQETRLEFEARGLLIFKAPGQQHLRGIAIDCLEIKTPRDEILKMKQESIVWDMEGDVYSIIERISHPVGFQ
ncbi:MAG TPA: hypothetical protein DCY35_04725 [Prolixibacteraceae bacterium]|nr:hypothetical protein [Prolixibacteraceae bacterium]